MEDLTVRLLEKRQGNIGWTGMLSGSALSTAVSVFAFNMNDPAAYHRQIEAGLNWLLQNVNDDGAWGDTVKSCSNISTTLLVLAAMEKADGSDFTFAAREKARIWIAGYCGSMQPQDIARAVYSRYDNDKTFSAPIMTVCALAGLLGDDRRCWQYVSALPFELSVMPQRIYGYIGFPVVSYALPALIAIGQVVHHFNPSANPLISSVRKAAIKPSLARLAKIQPENGGFLEASPLTAFVAASLAAKGLSEHRVTQKCLSFLQGSQRSDGSWPIDTDLAVWLTTLSINALARAGSLTVMPAIERSSLARYILSCQYDVVHPYTLSKPGGWSWTDKPGAVPDADDTAGAIVALANLVRSGVALDDSVTHAIVSGSKWLCGIQNRDGGLPTFCRGWGKLPFDRSCNDITAHAIAAWSAAMAILPGKVDYTAEITRALHFLAHQQARDGWWEPLWFGSEYMPEQTNPVYGTSRVIVALADVPSELIYLARPMLERATSWLLTVQCSSGGFSGGVSARILNSQEDLCSIEETALALTALKTALAQLPVEKQAKTEKLQQGIVRATDYLKARLDADGEPEPAPIGFYFAKLWYYEELYPLIFLVSAL